MNSERLHEIKGDASFDGISCNFSGSKITPHHIKRKAFVYIRQSSAQQVQNNIESTRRQYELASRAKAMGWPEEQINIIDEDLGKSGQHTDNRTGFKRLLAELALDRVGIILVLEMSRLARSCKDWYQLIEVCGIFSTLLADPDGVYDPTDYNDRLLLGLRGTMSEAELHVMRNRLWMGKLNKARRGELRNGHPPVGYVYASPESVMLDPDARVQDIVRLVFRKFREIGTIHGVLRYLVEQDVRMGIRSEQLASKGDLLWVPPNQSLLTRMLHNPWYAGAYAFGRTRIDHRKRDPAKPGSGVRHLPMNEWFILIKDCFPPYISWEEFQSNQERLSANATKCGASGAVRNGRALLVGLLKCRKCSLRMTASYRKGSRAYQYMCVTGYAFNATLVCQHFAGRRLDDFVAAEILRAIEPCRLELSLQAIDQVERERADVDKRWQQRIEHATYEAGLAERRYRAIDPENSLVARNLENGWENTLRQLKTLQTEYQTHCEAAPRRLTQEERDSIRSLSQSLPTVWNAASSTPRDKKEIIRWLIDEIFVERRTKSDLVEIEIVWKGGRSTRHTVCHSVGSYQQKHDFKKIMEATSTMQKLGASAEQIATRLNAEGLRPAVAEKFHGYTVRNFMQRVGLTPATEKAQHLASYLAACEWTLSMLASELGIPRPTLSRWQRQGLVKCRRLECAGRPWIIWADDEEMAKLKHLHEQRRSMRGRTHETEAR